MPTGKSLRNNGIALAALCQMSDIVANATTSAPRIMGSTFGAVTPCTNSSGELEVNLVGSDIFAPERFTQANRDEVMDA